MDKMNRISPYTVCRCDAPEKVELYGDANVLERFDYADLLRILPEGNYTNYRVREVHIGNVITMTVCFSDDEGWNVTGDIRFHGDGMIDIYAPINDGWIVAKYDDHNWKIVNNSPSRVFNTLMDSFVKVWKKENE
jgi:hypothetical protein